VNRPIKSSYKLLGKYPKSRIFKVYVISYAARGIINFSKQTEKTEIV